jgi:hypothetical protein
VQIPPRALNLKLCPCWALPKNRHFATPSGGIKHIAMQYVINFLLGNSNTIRVRIELLHFSKSLNK